jgi:hypothetical protein
MSAARNIDHGDKSRCMRPLDEMDRLSLSAAGAVCTWAGDDDDWAGTA